ncbi:MAG TPA: M20 family metallopeptidase [Ktedonobacteraceae bacterium]
MKADTVTTEVEYLVLSAEKYVEHRLPHYIEELRELCLIDSNTYYKPGLDEVALYLEDRMRKLGMSTTIIEHEDCGNDLLGTIQGSGTGNVLLLGHMDTVYPVGTAAARPLRVEGDTIYGPGASDMKGCILSALYALEAVFAANCRSFGEIRFLCVSDEEILKRHSLGIIREISQGCQAALVLEAARANGAIVSSRKGNAGYTLKVKGRSAHTGVEPEKGRNAIVELSHQILQFESLNGWREGLTINAGMCSGGVALNVVPDYAEAQIDLRFSDFRDKTDVENVWQRMIQQNKIVGTEVMLEAWPDCRQPMLCTPQSLTLVDCAREISHILGFSLEHVMTGGSSDASYTSGSGIPTLDGLGPIGGRDHSPDEYLVKSSIAQRSALLAGLITSVKAQDL